MLKKICQCVGIASLILVVNYGDLLGGGADVRMHYPLALTKVCLAQIADILLLGLVLFAGLLPLSRTRFYPWVRLVLAIVIPPYLLERAQSILPFDLIDGLVPLLAVGWAAVLLLLMLRFPRWYKETMRFGSAVCMAFVLFAISSLGQLVWVATWKPGPQQKIAAWEKPGGPPREHPLLVWVVFDELSYDQVFEHRAHGLELPNFDALRGESTLFTDVQPAGYHTKEIIPSLLSGEAVDSIHFSMKNRFMVHTEGEQKWHPLTGEGTVFGDAQKNGWRTAAVGWYNPYCTTYGDALDNCYWSNRDKMDGPMAQQDSLGRNVASPFGQLYREVKSPSRADRDLCTFDVRERYQTHLDLEKHMMDVLHTDQADLVFLHMDVPHSPNIWSRIRDGYTQKCDSSYLDNLVLADRVLGEMVATLKASPRWKDTTMIVEGDHGWRIDLWNWLPAWTDEDDAASREVFDPRPALIVHQAGQTTPETNGTAWPLLKVHGVVEQLVKGQKISY